MVMQMMKFGQRHAKADKTLLMPAISPADLGCKRTVFQRLIDKL
jgi:hypothetical protein